MMGLIDTRKSGLDQRTRCQTASRTAQTADRRPQTADRRPQTADRRRDQPAKSLLPC
jgi:hypothetical protein